jgi:hypothetical protein
MDATCSSEKSVLTYYTALYPRGQKSRRSPFVILLVITLKQICIASSQARSETLSEGTFTPEFTALYRSASQRCSHSDPYGQRGRVKGNEPRARRKERKRIQSETTALVVVAPNVGQSSTAPSRDNVGDFLATSPN